MPTTTLAFPITTLTIWISSVVVLLLVVIPIFFTRAVYVRKNARLRQRMGELEELNRKLELGGILPQKADNGGKSDKGWVQQVVSIVVAIGGLAGLLGASTPLLRQIQEMKNTTVKLDRQNQSLEFFNNLLGFTETRWKDASEVEPIGYKPSPKPRAYEYGGQRPDIIEVFDGSTIKFKLPSNGARFLIRPK
jgi:hypothetical protein